MKQKQTKNPCFHSLKHLTCAKSAVATVRLKQLYGRYKLFYLHTASTLECFTKAFNTGAVVFAVGSNFEGVY